VPEGESVRLAALQASWRRDRWVARRRIWLRWTLWGAQRYGVPAIGALGVIAGLWFAVRATMGWLETPSPTEPVAAIAPQATPPETSTTAAAQAPEPAPLTTTDPNNASPASLRFKPSLRISPRIETPVSSAKLPDLAKFPNPQLISENWLHSKEP
jgi:hypothetical protein